MNSFQYDNTQSTPEKKNQSEVAKIVSVLDRKLTYKVLDFVDKI